MPMVALQCSHKCVKSIWPLAYQDPEQLAHLLLAAWLAEDDVVLLVEEYALRQKSIAHRGWTNGAAELLPVGPDDLLVSFIHIEDPRSIQKNGHYKLVWEMQMFVSSNSEK